MRARLAVFLVVMLLFGGGPGDALAFIAVAFILYSPGRHDPDGAPAVAAVGSRGSRGPLNFRRAKDVPLTAATPESLPG